MISRRCVKCHHTIVLKQGNRPICAECRRKPKPKIRIVVEPGFQVEVIQGK